MSNQLLAVVSKVAGNSIENTRPFGFSKRRYLLVKLMEIQESEPPSPDITVG